MRTERMPKQQVGISLLLNRMRLNQKTGLKRVDDQGQLPETFRIHYKSCSSCVKVGKFKSRSEI